MLSCSLECLFPFPSSSKLLLKPENLGQITPPLKNLHWAYLLLCFPLTLTLSSFASRSHALGMPEPNHVSVSTERTVSVLQGYSFNKAIWLATVCEALLWVPGMH